MKRRDFLKATRVVLTGLVGIERLTQAMAGNYAAASVVTEAVCGGKSIVTCNKNYECNGEGIRVYCDVDYKCESDKDQVTCKGSVTEGYEFECQGYSCVRDFSCEDYNCQPNWTGDFVCESAFTCNRMEDGSEFDCLGTDPFDAQFGCNAAFTCKGSSGSEQVYCEDFYCRSQQFTCEGRYTSDCPRGVTCIGEYTGPCSDVVCNPRYTGRCEENVQCLGDPGYSCSSPSPHGQPIQPPPIEPPPSPQPPSYTDR